MDILYNLNDFDVVKEYLIRKDHSMFQTYNNEITEELTKFYEKIGFIKQEINYRF